jgi:hypothetical protein
VKQGEALLHFEQYAIVKNKGNNKNYIVSFEKANAI